MRGYERVLHNDDENYKNFGSSLSFSESGEFLAVGVPAESRSEIKQDL